MNTITSIQNGLTSQPSEGQQALRPATFVLVLRALQTASVP